MFQISESKPIDPELSNFVKKLESEVPGTQVLAARKFKYQQVQQLLNVYLTEPRRFNVLEEYIIRASLEISPAPQLSEIAALLGLDPIFVDSTVRSLQNLNVLQVNENNTISLTPQGLEFFQEKCIPKPPTLKHLWAVSDPLRNSFDFLIEPSSDIPSGDLNGIPFLESVIDMSHRLVNAAILSPELLLQFVQNCSLSLHNPNEGRILIRSELEGEPERLTRIVSIFLVYDELENKLVIHFSDRHNLEASSEWLTSLMDNKSLDIRTMMNIPGFEQEKDQLEDIDEEKDPTVDEFIEDARKQALAHFERLRNPKRKQTIEKKDHGNAEQLRDAEIRNHFIKSLSEAKHQVLIYSPWVTEDVIDHEFLDLLKKMVDRGAWVLIGYGISRGKNMEDRPLNPELEKRIREIRSPEGIPAVQIHWLGKSHAKEVVVDKKVHICGSHNWLSYRGDRLPRGETVYKVTIPEQVDKAYQFLAKRFCSAVDNLWKSGMELNNLEKMIDSLCVWCAFYQEEYAFEKIKAENQISMIPILLRLMEHNIFNSDSDLRHLFQQLIDFLENIEVKESYNQPFSRSVVRFLKKSASMDYPATLRCLGGKTWEFLIKSSWVETSETPDQWLKGFIEPKKPMKKKKKK